MNDMPIFLRFSGIEYECPEKKKPVSRNRRRKKIGPPV